MRAFVVWAPLAERVELQGTFEAAIDKLAYLRDLGVSHMELMPVNAFTGIHGWGYDGVHLDAPHHAYGGPEGLKRLVDACHREGLAPASGPAALPPADVRSFGGLP